MFSNSVVVVDHTLCSMNVTSLGASGTEARNSPRSSPFGMKSSRSKYKVEIGCAPVVDRPKYSSTCAKEADHSGRSLSVLSPESEDGDNRLLALRTVVSL